MSGNLYCDEIAVGVVVVYMSNGKGACSNRVSRAD